MTLVDTGVWFRYYHRLPLNPELLTYLTANPPLYLSAISVWEVATKHRLGRLPCPPLAEWLEEALADYMIIDVTPRIAWAAGETLISNQDPADRIIVISAVQEGLVLLHTDRQIRSLRLQGFKQRYFRAVNA
jgi:PIN domain nuclease of toxin-antitoxin system